MSDPSYDGLCGIPCPSPLRDGSYLRCRFEFGHSGDHSWKKHENHSLIFGGITHEEVVQRAAQGSPAAQAILGTGCPKLISPELLRRPANALNVEIGQPMSRCKLKTPENWGSADPEAVRWLWSGGSPLVLGLCTPNACPFKSG